MNLKKGTPVFGLILGAALVVLGALVMLIGFWKTLALCALFAVGYFLGTSNMAYYLSKLKGVDLRKRGSGNLGTCNAFMELGWKASVLVFLHDAGKAALAVLLTAWLFPAYAYSQHIAGVCAVLGHIFPFYLKFKGGKGHAAYIGMAFAINWLAALIATPICIIALFVTDYIFGLIVATITVYPLVLFCFGEWQAALIVLIASAFAAYFMRENFQHIKEGTEKKFLASFLGKEKKDEKTEPVSQETKTED